MGGWGKLTSDTVDLALTEIDALDDDTEDVTFEPVQMGVDGQPARNCFVARWALLDEGWRENVLIRYDEEGLIDRCEPDTTEMMGVWYLNGTVVPGLCSAHSHAFQRAMAGLGEAGAADFWVWREAMYRLAGRLDPDDMRAIAAWVQLEMLLTGYTNVVEFHYLHNRPDGGQYDNPAIMAEALDQASRDSGIDLVICPSLYMTGGFDGRPLEGVQRRFAGTPERILDLTARLKRAGVPTALGLHSLRAVPPDPLRQVVEAHIAASPGDAIHIHIAEQLREVEECIAARGARPVDWLLDNAPVDDEWCLVHATHMTEAETRRMAASGCVAGLCPTTEANLADGLFPLSPYLGAGGRFAIGSDSNVRIDPFEELRFLDYGQRLVTGRRGLPVDAQSEGVGIGTRLWRAADLGGKQAMGMPPRGLTVGHRCDILLIDNNHPSLMFKTKDDLLASMIYSAGPEAIQAVIVGGNLVIDRGYHPNAAMIEKRFQQTMRKLLLD